ncbi:preprotein translocase subunit SecA [Pseudomonas syringae pv. actinidiae]|nr:preprotein translocase subunit SecA [Pseudomonas syringae pv. actinidiae]
MFRFTRVLKTKNQRTLQALEKTVKAIGALKLSDFSDAELKSQSIALRERVKNSGKISDKDVIDSFALVREASRRTLQMYHYDVQIIGGLVLHDGKVAEMRTGEGKTLVATLPAYLNSILGQVHIVTVNDYLAKRDCEIVKPVFEFLGVSSAPLQESHQREARSAVYSCDIVYGTSSQFGFDYLKDNMVFNASDRLQKTHHYAIIDEADSVLIDEARTPLIISGEGQEDVTRYARIMDLVRYFTVSIKGEDTQKDDAEAPDVDAVLVEKTKSSRLTDKGYEKLESMMAEMGVIKTSADLYSQQYLTIVTDFQTAIKAKYLYERDVSYIVRNGKIEIIDENTGRIAEGRRWSDGLHQFVEAKEGVQINPETVVMGSITLQNYFKLYDKISGMTGTADTEASELHNVYKLDVVVIPTNKTIRRIDDQDILFMSEAAKLKKIVDDIIEKNQAGRPVLVGTASVEKSEEISKELDRVGLSHNVLNAKNHAQEAMIIAQAGRSKAITIATNMAGRGTDIILGGNAKMLAQNLVAEDEGNAAKVAIQESCNIDCEIVIAAGGLHVIGTERHDSRRIDNQLRGRAGRQGDPGSSAFYVALQDRLMRINGGDKLLNICKALGLKADESISHSMIRRAIEKSQIAIENHSFEQRKELIKFDEVTSKQRKEIYSFRNEVLDASDETLRTICKDIISKSLTDSIKRFIPDESYAEQWDYTGLENFVEQGLGIAIPLPKNVDEVDVTSNAKYVGEITSAYETVLEASLSIMSANGQSVSEFYRSMLLQSVDTGWREIMQDMDTLKDGIHLRGYSQKDPKMEFARESVIRFSDMINDISENFMISSLRTAKEVARLIFEEKNNQDAA